MDFRWFYRELPCAVCAMGYLQHSYQLLNILVAALLQCKAETNTSCKDVPFRINRVRGDNVSMSCQTTIHQPDTLVVKLRRTNPDEQILNYSVPDSSPALQHQRWSVRTDAGNVTLDLKDITLTDTGQYECEVQNGDGDWYCLTKFNLKVKECKILNPVSARPKTLATLICLKHLNVTWEVVQGDQSTDIAQYSCKHSNTVGAPKPFCERATVRNGSLLIRDVLNTDASWYRCTVNQTSCYEVNLQVKDEAFSSTTVLATLSTTLQATALTDATTQGHTVAETASVTTAAVSSVLSVCVAVSLIVCVILYLRKRRSKNTSQMEFTRNSLYFPRESVYYSQIAEGLEYPLDHSGENNPGSMTTFGAQQTEATECKYVKKPMSKCSS